MNETSKIRAEVHKQDANRFLIRIGLIGDNHHFEHVVDDIVVYDGLRKVYCTHQDEHEGITLESLDVGVTALGG